MEEIDYFFIFIQAFGSEAKITNRRKVFLFVCFNVDIFSHNTYLLCTYKSYKYKNHSTFQSFPYVFPHTCWEKIATLEVQYFILKSKYFQKINQCSLIYGECRQHQVLIQLLKKHHCCKYQGESFAA